MNPSRRTVLTTAAWATPVIAMAVAVPAFAASVDTLQLNGIYLGNEGIRSQYSVTLTNMGSTTIAAGALTVTATYGAGAAAGGWGSDGSWSMTQNFVTFVFTMPLEPGDTTDSFVISVDNTGAARSAASFTLMATASGYEPAVASYAVYSPPLALQATNTENSGNTSTWQIAVLNRTDSALPAGTLTATATYETGTASFGWGQAGGDWNMTENFQKWIYTPSLAAGADTGSFILTVQNTGPVGSLATFRFEASAPGFDSVASDYPVSNTD